MVLTDAGDDPVGWLAVLAGTLWRKGCHLATSSSRSAAG
jgi:hypothetical protein